MKDLSKNISLHCSVCGNDQFSTIDDGIEVMKSAPDNTEIKCSDCGRIVTKTQLIEENEYLINSNIEDLKKEAMKEVEKEFKRIFK